MSNFLTLGSLANAKRFRSHKLAEEFLPEFTGLRVETMSREYWKLMTRGTK